MKRQYFGTDGVRGEFGGPNMNPAFAWRLGVAAGRWLKRQETENQRVLIGRDTRFSGPVLESALAAGLAETGAEVESLGVVPTPAVSFGVRNLGAALGVVVTASHNPATDNGIKFFSASGTKLDDADELEIENLLPPVEDAPVETTDRDIITRDVTDAFLARLSSVVPADALAGWRVAIDAANGAAYRTTPEMFRRLGAEVHVINDQPDGRNINDDCGSQHPDALMQLVKSSGAKIGIAHDGDADRVVFVDEQGGVLGGDEVLAILAGDALKHDRLNHRTLVATVQSNMGLGKFMEQRNGMLVRTAVGDRYVAEAMIEGGYNLGGENSGHIICTDVSPCGDGLAAALLMIRAMLSERRPLSELRGALQPFPQLSRALGVSRKPDIATLPGLTGAVSAAESELGDNGRVLVRYSGTEPKIRLLVEGADETVVNRLMGSLESAVAAELGG